MKIVSFPHYTCGGVLCDILNNTWSPLSSNGGVASPSHVIGKIGDCPGIFDDYDQKKLQAILDLDIEEWIGTHCWLGPMIDQDWVHDVVNITTMTHRSRVYRWARACHHYYQPSIPWQTLQGMDLIDKQRETAKNYLEPFRYIDHPRVVNIEFSEIVEGCASFLEIAGSDVKKHMDRWASINQFLYDPLLWQSEAVQRFHEAEYELVMHQMYQYH